MSLYDDAVLVMIPSAFKATKLYSVKPTDGTGDFTVANAGTKFRTNSDLKLEEIPANTPALEYDTVGGCPTLKLNEANTNLLERPLSFGHSDWDKTGSTIEGDASTAVAFESDDMSTNAKLTDWTSNGDSFIFDTDHYEFATSAINKSALYKSGAVSLTVNQMYKITIDCKDGTAASGSFKLVIADGVEISLSPIITTTTGWVTHYMYAIAGETTAGGFIGIDKSSDYSGGNIELRNFTVTEVTGYPSPSVTYPTDAYKLVESVVDEPHYISVLTPSTASVAHSLSIFAKQDGRRYIILSQNFDGLSNKNTCFDLELGTLIYDGSEGNKIISLINGWYRISCIETPTGSLSRKINIYMSDVPITDDNEPSYTGDGTSGVYIAFAQLSEKSYAPTFTYSGTEGATSSMLADVITGGGDAALFAGVNASGVLYAEYALNTDNGTSGTVELRNNAYTQRISIQSNLAGSYRLFVRSSDGTEIFNEQIVSSTLTDFNKIAVRWKSGDNAVYYNGVLAASNNTTFTNTLEFEFVEFGALKVNESMVFNVLSNIEMSELTTP